MRQNKVTNGIGALDRVFVTVKRFQEPGVFIFDESSRLFIRPELFTTLAKHRPKGGIRKYAKERIREHSRYIDNPDED